MIELFHLRYWSILFLDLYVYNWVMTPLFTIYITYELMVYSHTYVQNRPTSLSKKQKKSRPTSPIHSVDMVALTPCLGELTPHVPSGEEEHYWTKICKLYHFYYQKKNNLCIPYPRPHERFRNPNYLFQHVDSVSSNKNISSFNLVLLESIHSCHP